MIEVTIDIRDVEQGLNAMERRAHTLGATFAGLKVPMRADQKEHAANRTGPDGAWPVRVHRSHMPRQPLGKLPTAVTYKAFPWGLVGESKVAWSLSQQDGGKVGRGSRLPARPFLWISGKLLAIAAGAIERALLAAYGGR